MLVTGSTGAGKALALDTPIPTPSGWTTMGSIQVGDQVIGSDGRPVTVTKTSEVMYSHKCYRVEFDDGTSIVADAEHLWLTEDRKYRGTLNSRMYKRKLGLKGPQKRLGGKLQPQNLPRSTPLIRTTEELAETLMTPAGAKNHAIRNATRLELPAAELPIEPYLLGAWLGDGHSGSARMTCADPMIVEVIAGGGTAVSAPKDYSRSGKAKTYQFGDSGGRKLHTLLREEGLLDNKHVPVKYLRASAEQRMALLAGLMDTDGTVEKGRTCCIFTSTNKNLANAVEELAVSFGWKARIRTRAPIGRRRKVRPRLSSPYP